MDLQFSRQPTVKIVDADRLRQQIIALAESYSLETTPRESAVTASYGDILPAGKTVNIAFLPDSDFTEVAHTAARLRREGFEPVPHLPARAFTSEQDLRDALALLRDSAGVTSALVIAGGIDRPRGPFPDTMTLLETGLLPEYGITRIGVGGHPEDSPEIDNAALRSALAAKNAFAVRNGLDMHIATQFCLDAAPILAWEHATRRDGVTLPIDVGLPGATTLKSLMKYAKICGVGASRRVLARNTRKLIRLSAVSYPDRLVTAIAHATLADPSCRFRRLHFFPFGGLTRTVDWLARIAAGEFEIDNDQNGYRILESGYSNYGDSYGALFWIGN